MIPNKLGGEIPLNPYDSCRLIAVNLYSYVENPFTNKAKFNWKLFKEHVIIAQRLMDDLVDLEIEKLDAIISKIESDPEDDSIKSVELNLWKSIRQMAIDGRRTGLGVTAEGDMLAALGLIYGSDDAIDFAEEVHKQLAISAYESSIQLAKERGSFNDFNLYIEETLQSKFLDRIINEISEESKIDYQLSGRRNIACLTIAPTGTTSLMTQTSSGIEPVFLPVYKRRRKTLDKDKATFVDKVGDMWEEYTVYHHKYLDWIKVNNHDLRSDRKIEDMVDESPYYKATSNDVDYIKKVEMQGRIQKWVDHSISVTVNMHKDVTIQDVADVYKKAWESGCKGVTVYRDGSRDGVLVSNETKVDDFEQHSAPKRPKELDCIVKHIKVKGVDFTVLIGLLNDKPYEIFGTEGNINYSGNTIVKLKKNKYLCGDLPVAENMSDDQKTITRLISTALRHGADNKFIVDQLSKIDGEMTGFSKALSRALKQFIKDGEKSSESCPECGNKLTFANGCKQCDNCGHSFCS